MISKPPLPPEILQTIKKVVILTRQGLLPWETTADPDVLVTPLGGDYAVRVEQVPDLDGEDADSDHVFTLSKGRKPLFSVDRRDLWTDELRFKREFADILPEDELFPYRLLKELWERAYFKAAKISDELEALNRLLDGKLRSGGG